MDVVTMKALTEAGAFCAIGFAAAGSAMGCGAAGASIIGSWKKCYLQNKPAPFLLLAFVGAPLSQTIYGMIIMFIIIGKVELYYKDWPLFIIMGVISGVGMGASAWMQGKAGAGACDAFAETEKGFTNYLMALGIIETVAIFVMAFGIVLLASVTVE